MNRMMNQAVNQSFEVNIPKVTISSAVDMISCMLTRAIRSGFDIQKLHSTMLWGAPGVGKSEGVKEIARQIEINTNKKVFVRDVRLLMFSPTDLRGIPVANNEKTEAIWLRPEIFDMVDDENTINILFLDEITAAPQSVQACAYQITLDHKLGEHYLPNNTYVICAGNRKNDNSVSNQMPKALCNRMMHFDVISDYEEWKQWAIRNNINDQVIGFLQYKPEFLCKGCENKNDIAFASPRTWEMVSNILNLFDGNIGRSFVMISGLVGIGIASEFISFCRFSMQIPNVDDIFEGKVTEIPENPDILYSLISAMSTKAREYLVEGKSLDNAIDYAMRFNADFSFVYYSSLIELIKIYNPDMIYDSKIECWGNMFEDKVA